MGNSTPPSKSSWPEVVGLTAGDAEKKIKEDMPDARVQIVPPDHFVTMDFRNMVILRYLYGMHLQCL
ncbi:uncharacterized protein A4U43_C02F1090 [Asparagus officinalis]|uniref:Uncharacterized protein n=1 Tax=Asparagus officinalis TaxID=4686 RepID=A0A5P1FGQ6_ASPOF|nr:uncharacterized protein A4U43_C02F1090 [Asparagus officinalis]